MTTVFTCEKCAEELKNGDASSREICGNEWWVLKIERS